MEVDTWDRVVAVCLRGTFLSMKHQIPLMLRTGGGAIVNASSGVGLRGSAGGAAYSAAKHGWWPAVVETPCRRRP